MEKLNEQVQYIVNAIKQDNSYQHASSMVIDTLDKNHKFVVTIDKYYSELFQTCGPAKMQVHVRIVSGATCNSLTAQFTQRLYGEELYTVVIKLIKQLIDLNS